MKLHKKLHLRLFMVAPPQRKSWLRLSYHRSSEHCILMDMLTTRKEAKSLPSDTLPGLKKLPKLLLLPGFCPGPHCGSLQHSPDPVVAFKAAMWRRGEREGKRQGGEGRKGREEGKGRHPQKVRWICQLGRDHAPSLLGCLLYTSPSPRDS